jgi:hypothetical protein
VGVRQVTDCRETYDCGGNPRLAHQSPSVASPHLA